MWETEEPGAECWGWLKLDETKAGELVRCASLVKLEMVRSGAALAAAAGRVVEKLAGVNDIELFELRDGYAKAWPMPGPVTRSKQWVEGQAVPEGYRVERSLRPASVFASNTPGRVNWLHPGRPHRGEVVRRLVWAGPGEEPQVLSTVVDELRRMEAAWVSAALTCGNIDMPASRARARYSWCAVRVEAARAAALLPAASVVRLELACETEPADLGEITPAKRPGEEWTDHHLAELLAQYTRLTEGPRGLKAAAAKQVIADAWSVEPTSVHAFLTRARKMAHRDAPRRVRFDR